MMHARLAGDVLADDLVDGRLVGVLDMEGTDGTAALDKRDDRALCRGAVLALLDERTAAGGDGRAGWPSCRR